MTFYIFQDLARDEFAEMRFCARLSPCSGVHRIFAARPYSFAVFFGLYPFSIPPRSEIPFRSKWSFTPLSASRRVTDGPGLRVRVRIAHWQPSHMVDAAAATAAAAAAKLVVISVRQQSWLTGWPSNRPGSSSGCWCCCCSTVPLSATPLVT